MKRKKLVSRTTQKRILVKASDFCWDLAKLVFGGIILAGIMDMEINKSYLLVVGSVVLILLSVAAIVLMIISSKL